MITQPQPSEPVPVAAMPSAYMSPPVDLAAAARPQIVPTQQAGYDPPLMPAPQSAVMYDPPLVPVSSSHSSPEAPPDTAAAAAADAERLIGKATNGQPKSPPDEPSPIEISDEVEERLRLLAEEPATTEPAEEQAEPSSSKVQKKVVKIFVGGLSNQTSKDDLRDHFGKFGKIVACEIPLSDDRKPLRKGFALVYYESSAAAESACAQQFQEINGKRVEVRRDKKAAKDDRKTLDDEEAVMEEPMPEEPAPATVTAGTSTQIFINYPNGAPGESDLIQHFGRYGEVVDLRKNKGGRSGISAPRTP